MAPVIDYGKVFIGRASPGCTGAGVTKAHHLVQVGNFHRAHVRIAEPYFVDRRFRGSSAWTRDRPCRAANGEKEGGIVHMASCTWPQTRTSPRKPVGAGSVSRRVRPTGGALTRRSSSGESYLLRT